MECFDDIAIWELILYQLPYTSKHSREKTFTVHQQYALCRENFRGLQTKAPRAPLQCGF